ncbi:copper-binding protein [Sodalis sp. RH19]|uniref:copper-binding protein n=1 Tax=Sodalis sp. RH19 TaxID=3394334 RepID=UPI0039B6915C
MKKNLITLAVAMIFASSAWAAETVDVHDQINNAQAPAHQMMSSKQDAAIQGTDPKTMDMDEHGKAALSHENLKNSNSPVHQSMAEMHKKQIKNKAPGDTATSKTFTDMSEHEKAAVAHEKSNNGQSSIIHEQQAEQHRGQDKTN